MAQHDAFRRARRAGSILEKGERLARDSLFPPLVLMAAGLSLNRLPEHEVETAVGRDQWAHLRQDVRSCERHGRLGIGDDRGNAREGLILSRWIDWNGNGPGVETSEESRDVIQPRRIEKQRAFALSIQ